MSLEDLINKIDPVLLYEAYVICQDKIDGLLYIYPCECDGEGSNYPMWKEALCVSEKEINICGGIDGFLIERHGAEFDIYPAVDTHDGFQRANVE